MTVASSLLSLSASFFKARLGFVPILDMSGPPDEVSLHRDHRVLGILWGLSQVCWSVCGGTSELPGWLLVRSPEETGGAHQQTDPGGTKGQPVWGSREGGVQA